ncbi:hypothetical protein RJ40_12165 [Methanofollis aquaemaris]|uniref:YcdB/YcdC repeated domain-containing protein n=1 Tax=Methanofollis aquaemaris TaxID=126734 RepID=A0A8A3S7U0_9EURY|nr:PepSY domain-containing protein [Methanofollis aquaemaris]QSZ68195.1 hypothetical protein RJ40_12165 [Methanofollis aquaemaris]
MNRKISFFLSLFVVLAVFVIFIFISFSGSGQADPVRQSPSPSPTPPETTTPATEITKEEAKAIAADAFPEIVGPDTAKVRFEQITDALGERRSWEVDDYSANLNVEGARHAQVWVDAATGEIMEFAIHTGKKGRPDDPVLSEEEACACADEFFQGREEGAILERRPDVLYQTYTSLVEGGKEVAGFYRIWYARLVREVPCSGDGCDLEVDAVNGETRRFCKTWALDESRCRADTTPSIQAEEAEERAGAYLKETYGDLPGLTIHTTLLKWADHPFWARDPSTAVPLGWEVTFDNDHYRSLTWPRNATAWVDAHTGEVFACDYRPDLT